MKKATETQLVKACLELLRIRRIFAWRNNTGGVTASYKGKSRFVRFGAVGSSDILGLIPPSGRLLAVEAKVKPNKPTETQDAFLEAVERAGGLAVVAYSVADLAAALEAV